MQSFTVDQHTFSQVPSGDNTRIWCCDAKGILISERLLDPHPLSKCTAERGSEVLSRRGHPRKFADPQLAAKAALAEWR